VFFVSVGVIQTVLFPSREITVTELNPLLSVSAFLIPTGPPIPGSLYCDAMVLRSLKMCVSAIEQMKGSSVQVLECLDARALLSVYAPHVFLQS
jgi:hypothetical protein